MRLRHLVLGAVCFYAITALPPKADMSRALADVRQVPETDTKSKEPGRLGRVLALVYQLKANQS